MQQEKIGKFIAEKRKQKGLTQLQLAEKLCITDRAVSKWETGRSMPDSSIMLLLCEVLDMEVNELLNGEEIKDNDLDKKQKELILELVKEKENSDKKLLAVEVAVGILSVIVLLGFIFIAAFIPMETWTRILLIALGFILGLSGIFVAVKIEQVAGYYECAECGHKYVPTFKSVLFAMHMGRTRYMKCPKCGKKSWQKKVVSKD